MGLLMSKRDRLKVEKEEEMRTKGSSKMISEGGLGADPYYKIVKETDEEEKDKEDKDEKEQGTEDQEDK